MRDAHRKAFDFAAEQDSLITRPQARACGLSRHEIARLLADGLLISVAMGVFRVRGAVMSERMALHAAELATGGALCAASSARLFELRAPHPVAPIHTAVAGRHPRTRRIELETESHAFFRVEVHRSAPPARCVTVDGIRCHDAARTLIEIAADLDGEALEAAFERARKLGLTSIDALGRTFAELGGRGRPGTPKVRALLGRTRPGTLDSTLEVKAWNLLLTSALPEPTRQLWVPCGRARFRIDFAFEALLVAFETEGFEWHGDRARWKQDRARVAALERAGWRIVVATWDDVTSEPDATIARVAAALDERRRLFAA